MTMRRSQKNVFMYQGSDRDTDGRDSSGDAKKSLKSGRPSSRIKAKSQTLHTVESMLI
jgi:hypothetical protein